MVGLFIMIGVVAIVGLVLLQSSAQQVGETTRTVALANGSYNIGTTVNGVTDLIGMELLSTPLVLNASSGSVVVAAGNYTIAEGISATTGKKIIQYKKLTGDINDTVRISYTYGPDGYIEDSGAKAITAIIIVMFAVGIAVVVMVPTLRSGLIDMVRK